MCAPVGAHRHPRLTTQTSVQECPRCRNNFVAAWRLSALSDNRVLRAAAAPAAALVLVSLWLLLYMHVPLVRALGDTAVRHVHGALPEAMQAYAAELWHALLPDCVLTQVRLPFWPPSSTYCMNTGYSRCNPEGWPYQTSAVSHPSSFGCRMGACGYALKRPLAALPRTLPAWRSPRSG